MNSLYGCDSPGEQSPTVLQRRCSDNIGAVYRELGPPPPEKVALPAESSTPATRYASSARTTATSGSGDIELRRCSGGPRGIALRSTLQ